MLYTDNRQNIIEATEKLVNLINEVCNVALTEEEVNVPYQISLLFVDNNESYRCIIISYAWLFRR